MPWRDRLRSTPPGVEADAEVERKSKLEALSSLEAQGLLIQGYNYTDTFIDSFSVNGAGGGNIFCEQPDHGGREISLLL